MSSELLNLEVHIMINNNVNVVNFHLTNLCNYHCTHCFGKFLDKAALTYEKACLVVDNIARYFTKNGIRDGRINLAGGEPLLYPHLDELIDYINAYGIKVSIITNGSLLTIDRIAGWKDKVYCIGLSIDSALEETNVKIGRCCCNNKTLTIKQLVQITQAIHRNGIRLKINTVVSKLNVNEDMRVLYKRLKPDKLKLLQVEIVEGINDCARGIEISKKAFDEFCKLHKNSCSKVVFEQADDLENSYLMINPSGEVQLNNKGKYDIYGNCLKEELCNILAKTPLDENKFGSRYAAESKSTNKAKRLCVFGGHPTWIKAIKRHLTNAKFFEEGNLPSLDIIRNADEIWIQTNAISHSFYGKVKDTAIVNGIPINYFKFAGIQKCLE